MRIIPAIDIIGGKCVRLTRGDYTTQKIYNENPVEVARQFQDAGLKFLHLVDLDGAKSGGVVNYKVLEDIASMTKLKIDFGGGIKSHNDIKMAFNYGASQVTVGSIAAQNVELVDYWLSKYGSDKIILGADCSNRRIAINGWQHKTEIDVIKYIQSYQRKGFTRTICTDIAKDGMLLGPSFALYLEIITTSGIGLIASGGVASLKDIYRLKHIGCEGVIIGKALYEGKINLNDLTGIC